MSMTTCDNGTCPVRQSPASCVRWMVQQTFCLLIDSCFIAYASRRSPLFFIYRFTRCLRRFLHTLNQNTSLSHSVFATVLLSILCAFFGRNWEICSMFVQTIWTAAIAHDNRFSLKYSMSENKRKEKETFCVCLHRFFFCYSIYVRVGSSARHRSATTWHGFFLLMIDACVK